MTERQLVLPILSTDHRRSLSEFLRTFAMPLDLRLMLGSVYVLVDEA
jgi:hypothetical protein